ncbi:MAG: DUF427 domain-containing protein [Variovorax sp.]|nr:MAG: DUF427 domain-containing protein [Variovorax sp.]
MSKSPGHQRAPEHKVLESIVQGRMTVEVDGEVMADSSDVVRVDEDGYPARFYFPRDDVRMDRLTRSETTTQCPFKGTASYFSIGAATKPVRDLAWSYEQPYDEHARLKERLAFDESKSGAVRIRRLP